ncbi:MAG: hypothetical protein WC919_03555 [Candidatus Paceibacterota bacterium]|jgi:hypothetical protein
MIIKTVNIKNVRFDQMATSIIVIFAAILFFFIVMLGAYIIYLRAYVGYREHGRATHGMRVRSEPIPDEVYDSLHDD